MSCSKCGDDRRVILTTITDKNGSVEYCPNCLIEAYIEFKLDFENNPDFIDDVTGEHGAVKFESEGEIYILERERMFRLIAHNLDPDEYFALAKKYGANKFEIHDDFYDDFDGVAIQPVIR